MSTTTRAARDLDAAADLIERHGWLNQGGGSCNTGFCLSDALAHVIGRDGRDPHRAKRHAKAITALASYIREAREAADSDPVTISPIPQRTIMLYNDRYLTDRAEAVATLRAAATALRTPDTDEGNPRS